MCSCFDVYIVGVWSSWQYLFAFNAVPALVCLVLFPLCPESPRYLLIKKNDEDGAKKGNNLKYTVAVKLEFFKLKMIYKQVMIICAVFVEYDDLDICISASLGLTYL